MRRVVLGAMAVALLGGACADNAAPRPAVTATTTTVATTGPLETALVNQSQLRRVPGLATAVVSVVADPSGFDDPDPRGPCGARVPALVLDDAAAAVWQTSALRGGGQVVLRRPAAELRAYLAARIRDTARNCAPFATRNRQGVVQEMKFDTAVAVTRDADQSLAVVMAVRTNGALRAATTIEVRTGNVLSRAVLVSDRPLPTPTVRGIASLMAKAIESVS